MQNEQKTLTGGAMPTQVTGIVVPTTLVNNLTPIRCCPNCESAWSNEEIELQCCDCCGYPLHKEQAGKKDEEFDFENGFYMH